MKIRKIVSVMILIITFMFMSGYFLFLHFFEHFSLDVYRCKSHHNPQELYLELKDKRGNILVEQRGLSQSERITYTCNRFISVVYVLNLSHDETSFYDFDVKKKIRFYGFLIPFGKEEGEIIYVVE